MNRQDMQNAIEASLKDMRQTADAGETALFTQSLLYIFSKTYDIEYPELKARQIVPVNYEVPPGAETHRYYQMDRVGQAKLIEDYATDFPNIEIFGKAFVSGVVGIGDSYQYSLQNLRAAAMAKIDLPTRKAEIARQAIETKFDQLTAFGDQTALVDGFLTDRNNTAVGTSVTKGSQASGTTWATATNDEILADLLNLTKSVWVNTKQIHTANTLLVGTAGYARLAFNRFNQFSDKSLLTYILENVPGLKTVIPWVRLDAAGAGGKERIVAYDRNPNVAEVMVAQEFEQVPPQAKGMSFLINCQMRSGGVAVRYPVAISYMDGTEP